MILNLIIQLFQGNVPVYLLLLYTLYSLIALVLIFPVHECAHGLVALAFGDRTAKLQGRLTLNPLAHVDLWGFAMLMLFGFGWAKPVQVNTSNLSKRRLGMFCVAAAGPLSNVIFCFITYLIYGILSVSAAQNGILWLSYFSDLFYYMAIYNATFAVFNLIPFPPLDGSKLVGELLPFRLRFRYYNLERYSMIFFIVLIILMNRTNFVSLLSHGLLMIFTPAVNAILGGIFG